MFSQTYKNFKVLVVNNNSTDGTKAFLATVDAIEVINLEENVGPAGGFYEGIKYFTKVKRKDFVWLMDDDFFPLKSCLEELIEKSSDNQVTYPFVRNKKFKSVKCPGWWGVLVPTSIVDQVGYPLKELFFWAEDTEYLQGRIAQKFKYESLWVPQAKGVHFASRNLNYRKKWRYYYEIRNTVYYRLYVQEVTPARLFKLSRSWFKLFWVILAKDTDKMAKFEFFFRGTRDGLQKKLGKTIDPHAS